jgi:hypothetical protein
MRLSLSLPQPLQGPRALCLYSTPAHTRNTCAMLHATCDCSLDAFYPCRFVCALRKRQRVLFQVPFRSVLGVNILGNAPCFDSLQREVFSCVRPSTRPAVCLRGSCRVFHKMFQVLYCIRRGEKLTPAENKRHEQRTGKDEAHSNVSPTTSVKLD